MVSPTFPFLQFPLPANCCDDAVMTFCVIRVRSQPCSIFFVLSSSGARGKYVDVLKSSAAAPVTPASLFQVLPDSLPPRNFFVPSAPEVRLFNQRTHARTHTHACTHERTNERTNARTRTHARTLTTYSWADQQPKWYFFLFLFREFDSGECIWPVKNKQWLAKCFLTLQVVIIIVKALFYCISKCARLVPIVVKILYI